MVELVVVGSANMDRTVVVDRFPTPGETIIGGPVAVHQGGKGANQAVAAVRLGLSVAFVGRVGDDEDGHVLREGLRDERIDVTHLVVSRGISGAAFICVDTDGENTIVVSPGANALVTLDDVTAASDVIENAKVLLVQSEIPLEATRAALELASGIRVFNPAPAKHLPAEVLAEVDVLVPNANELATLTGRPLASTHDEIAQQASNLGVDNVVVTLGSDGALIVEVGEHTHLPAAPVRAVDTTGAGDVFCAAVSVGLARGLPLLDAAMRAVVTAGHATTVTGTRPPLDPEPARQET